MQQAATAGYLNSISTSTETGLNLFCPTSSSALSAAPSHTRPRIPSNENVGKMLVKRRDLFLRRKLVSDFCFVIAMLGIVLMIINMELSLRGFNGFQDRTFLISFFLKSCLSASTIILLCFIITYHSINMKICMIDNCIVDMRLLWSTKKIFSLLMELMICAIHPLPVKVEFSWSTAIISSIKTAASVVNESNKTSISSTPSPIKVFTERVSLDLMLSLPMFLRFYLLCRVLMLHSRLFQDASAQSLGALNRIHFNFRFIFKTLMNSYPEHVLILLISFVFLTFSWSLRVCEVNNEQLRNDIFNSMWVIAITFLSVGYGDMVPATYCGRTIAVATGMCGAGCTALVVAVLARKLQLTHAEKYVHNFVLEVELNKQLKHAAANVLREAWLTHKYSKIKNNKMLCLKHERHLVAAIRSARELRNERRRVTDNAVSLVEIHRAQAVTDNVLNELCINVKQLSNQIVAINEKLDKVVMARR